MPSLAPSPAFTLASPETGTSYPIYVSLPGKADGKGPFPVVLFMDGDDQFRYAAKAYEAARKHQSLPPLILIGVGYGASYMKPGNYRIRDYTPTAMATEGDSGKAKAFIRFLEGTLWVELKKRYPVSDELRGLAGHSLGSLLAVEALFQGGEFFQRILASAPSLWWDDRSVFKTVDALHRASASVRGRLYLSVGLKDSESMSGDLALFQDMLRKRPFKGLDVIFETFADKDHYNVLPDAFQAGLTALYG